MAAWTSVRVTDHSFGVLDDGQIPAEPADYSTGLIITMDTGARIYTGIDTGPVRVAAAFHTTPPTVPSDTREDWSEIVEASLHAPRGRLFVESLDHGPVPDLPLLSDAGPGWYRLRVCARGRDTAYDAVVAAPVEDYRIDIWPAAPSPNAVIRSTDRCGQGLRASAADRRVPPSPGPDTQTQIDAEERAATIRRQTLLQAAGGQAQNAPADSRLRRPEPGQPTPPLRNDQPGPS